MCRCFVHYCRLKGVQCTCCHHENISGEEEASDKFPQAPQIIRATAAVCSYFFCFSFYSTSTVYGFCNRSEFMILVPSFIYRVI